MFDRDTLRGRLTLAYTLALVVSLVLFGMLALVVLDRAQRSALDAQLATTGGAVLAVADGNRGRVAMDEADNEQLRDILGTKANGIVWQRDGKPAATSGRPALPGLRALALAATAPFFVSLGTGKTPVRAYVAPIVKAGKAIGAVAIWRETEAIETVDRNVGLAFAVAIPGLAGLAVLFGSAIARRALAPLARIAALAAEIEAHDLSARLAVAPGRDELGRLARTFDRMLERLQNAFERERRFTSDASHELRAPLSVIRAEADLALRRERSGEEYRHALRTIAEEADALESITRDLLSVARGDSEAGGSETIALAELVREAAGRLRLLAAKRGVTIDVAGEDDAMVRAAREPLMRAIVALLHNAIKYALQGGRVAVRVTPAGGRVDLEVGDDGPGFSADALVHGFERFWRDGGARAREGTGLGLAIARSIVLFNGGTIVLSNAPEGGAAVRVGFPAVAPAGPSAARKARTAESPPATRI